MAGSKRPCPRTDSPEGCSANFRQFERYTIGNGTISLAFGPRHRDRTKGNPRPARSTNGRDSSQGVTKRFVRCLPACRTARPSHRDHRIGYQSARPAVSESGGLQCRRQYPNARYGRPLGDLPGRQSLDLQRDQKQRSAQVSTNGALREPAASADPRPRYSASA